jgi:hypothetical protein
MICKLTTVEFKLRYEQWYIPLSVAVGLGPRSSEVRLDGETLHVKMGWAFEAHIPLASITRAESTDAPVLARGVHYGGGRWVVNGSGKGLVVLTIKPPARAKLPIGSRPLRSLWVSVTDPDDLIAACAAARA